ncbi:MAG: peroxide stress protein YaaA [Saprospiraceae bacterium]|nr:peroxide stress protein YaaA [Saprospiraceae bacterium]
MIVLTSPAKTLDENAGKDIENTTEPQFAREALQLVRILKKKKKHELQKLMSISDNLAGLNALRYKTFKKEFNHDNSNPSIYAFKGDVYQGLNVDDMTGEDLAFAQEHLRILSGLYGVLRPLDLMQAYRLEMGTTLENKHGSNLYHFWGDKITKAINKELKHHQDQYIINLASNEYYKAINKKTLKYPVTNISFKEWRNEKLTFISFNAKKARGMMMHYIIKNRITEIEHLKGFDYDGYTFNENGAKGGEFLFTR